MGVQRGQRVSVIRLTILGEPASKANSRKLATIGGRNVEIAGKKTRVGGFTRFIKSEKARDYEASAVLQIPADAKQMLTGPLRMTIRIFYASERPDLDESVILDILQAKYGPVMKGVPRELIRRGVYVNDRQVRERHVYHGIDRVNPRAEIEIEPLQAQQEPLFGLPQESTATRKARPRRASPELALADGKDPF